MYKGAFTMKDGTIMKNEATKYGGGIYMYRANSMMEGGEIRENKAMNPYDFGSGGAVYLYSTDFSMKGGKISRNESKGNGGGIYAYMNSLVEISGTAEISENTADLRGGGLWSDYTVTIKKNAKIINNTAVYKGGGIYTKRLVMDGGEICGNTATDGGGVTIHDYSANSTITSGKVSGNTATNSGGGFYITIDPNLNYNPTLTMDDTAEISGNTANVSGGGVYIGESSALIMEGGTIAMNTSADGSGVYVLGGRTMSLKGDGKIAEDNDVYLASSGSDYATIQVAGALTQYKVAIVTPSEYELGREILCADGTNVAEITDDICAQFALTPNPSGGEWIIAPDESGLAGILTKEKVPGGIEITTPGLETYTFAVTVGDDETPLSDGMTLHGGDTVTLKGIVDSQGNTPSGECTIKIQDGSGEAFTTTNASATGDAASTLSVTVPALPNEQTAKIYLELTLDGGTPVINKAISVTISG